MGLNRWPWVVLRDWVDPTAPICYGILKPGKHVMGGVPVVKVRNLLNGRIVADDLLHTDPAIDKAYERSRLRTGDLLLSIRGTTGTVAVVPKGLDGANITQDTARIRVRADLSRDFVRMALQSRTAQAFVRLNTIGQAVKGINIRDVRRIPIPQPHPRAQSEIARVLGMFDTALHGLRALFEARRRFKRGLMQELLTGRRRFKEFTQHPSMRNTRLGMVPDDWDVRPLGSLFSAVTRRNDAGVTLVLTASGEHGLVNQRDYFNRSVASDDLGRYYLLKKGEFAYNRSLMKGYPCGAIKRLEAYDEGVVSTLYTAFALTAPEQDAEFFAQAFEGGLLNEQLGRVIKVGARAHGLLNVTNDDFFDVNVRVPPLEEQRAIAALLNACDREIDLLNRLRVALDRQRRGVMELLLTGKVRIPA